MDWIKAVSFPNWTLNLHIGLWTFWLKALLKSENKNPLRHLFSKNSNKSTSPSSQPFIFTFAVGL